jgi:glycine cleavage system transcriptional repressor
MEHLALSAIGRDRPGIVAAVTRVLLGHRVNIEDSQMTILRGHFTMTLILGLPDGADREALEQDLETTGAQLGLEALSLKAVETVEGTQPEPSHIVTVYGSDHPGIVCATAEAIARHGYNITDLNTRLVGDAEGDPLYALMLEVAVPAGEAGELESAMSAVARDENVEVTVRELESDEL